MLPTENSIPKEHVTKLTIADIKANALKAFNEGRLTAQAPDTKDRVCAYYFLCEDRIARVCALGASMKLEIAEKYSHWGTVRNSGKELFDCTPETREFAAKVQTYHDSWCAAARHEGEEGYSEATLQIQENKEKFLALIWSN